ncbi:MAG: site-2 protease family protein [Candidatus Pacebacteria bacterium]|nr:site-2 protease family protein [Candidatus Paceibacterota bacterium]
MVNMIDSFFFILILITSVVIHEVAHGYVAYRYGDLTAQMAGRLTMNPLKHIDIVGSIIVPITLLLVNAGFLVGWAKPVPINDRNFTKRKEGLFAVSIAGICANFIIAIFFAIVLRVSINFGFYNESFEYIVSIIIFLNIILGFFNLIPIPPLDGSKILLSLLPGDTRKIEYFFDRYGIVLLIFFIIFVWDKFIPIVLWIYTILTGMSIIL